MSISKDQIQHVANLSKLEIDEKRSVEFSEKLGSILELIDKMQAVDTTGIPPMAHPIHQNQLLREDKAITHNLRDTYQAIAPEIASHHYLVPKVIE